MMPLRLAGRGGLTHSWFSTQLERKVHDPVAPHPSEREDRFHSFKKDIVIQWGYGYPMSISGTVWRVVEN